MQTSTVTERVKKKKKRGPLIETRTKQTTATTTAKSTQNGKLPTLTLFRLVVINADDDREKAAKLRA